MILILTCDGDVSVDIVIDWLIEKKHKFVRVNSYDFINCSFFYDLNSLVFKIGSKEIEIDKINAIWYRKFGFFKESEFYKKAEKKLHKDSLFAIQKEFYKTTSFFVSLFKHKKWLTNPLFVNLNKGAVLNIAKKHGLPVPDTFFLNNKFYLKKIMKNKNIISKSINDPIVVYEKFDKNSFFGMFTSKVENNDLKYLPNIFSSSYVQEQIQKDYEVRVFYINKRFFSMAIFSQNDPQTSIDFRKYNRVKPNRFLPYTLPVEIEKKLINVMNETGLNCASIDLIKSIDGMYYFLEINPVGQFGMVDFPCNYGLHEIVANELIFMDTTTTL